MANNEDSIEEKELLLYLDFQDQIDPKILQEPRVFFKMFDISKETPLVQLDSEIFFGKHLYK